MPKTLLRDRAFYEEQFEKLGKSPIQIAEEVGTYANRIRRELMYYGFKPRDRSEAQKNALKNNRSTHPTEGKTRSDEVKARISEAVANTWKGISDEERERRVQAGKDRWNSMNAEDRNTITTLAVTAIREASKHGSKLEHYLQAELAQTGLEVMFHRGELIPNEKLEVDLFIPSLGLAIEIDGPSHFLPVWGEARLETTIKTDDKKNQLLLSYGFAVLRLRYTARHMSDSLKRKVLDRIMTIVNSLLNSGMPTENADRLMIVEVD